MTAPVARFSRRMPVVEVAMISREVIEVARVIARRMPIIIFRKGRRVLYYYWLMLIGFFSVICV